MKVGRDEGASSTPNLANMMKETRRVEREDCVIEKPAVP